MVTSTFEVEHETLLLAVAEARRVKSGMTTSYVRAAMTLADFVLAITATAEAVAATPRCIRARLIDVDDLYIADVEVETPPRDAILVTETVRANFPRRFLRIYDDTAFLRVDEEHPVYREES